MYRFFVEESQIYDGTVHITGSDVNHIKNVLRMRPGEKILVSTGGEKEYHCAVSDFPEGEVLAAVEEVTAADRELPSGIVLFQGLPKMCIRDRNQHLTGGYFHWRRDFWLRLSAIFLYCLHRGLRIQPQQLDLFPPETDEIQLLITETSQSYHTPLRVTVHWCPANCNIRNLHLKFCFAKGGLLTPETCSYAAKQQVFHC